MKATRSNTPNCSQEVGNDLADWDGAGRVLGGVEDLELPLKVVVDVQD